MIKRGQITIFIIAALLVFMLFGFLMTSMQKKSPSAVETGRAIVEEAVFGYVNTCIDSEVKQGTTYFGLGPVAGARIEDYINNNLAACADFSVLRQQGIRVTAGNVSSEVEVHDRAITAMVTFPLLLESSDYTLTFNRFDYSLSRVAEIGDRGSAVTGAVTAVFDSVADSDLVRVSTDKRAEFTIPKGTKHSGKGELKVEERNFRSKTNDIAVGNKAYSITGIAFQPYATLKIKYENDDVPKGYDHSYLIIARFDDKNDVWYAEESTVDKASRSVTAKITLPAFYSIVVGCKPIPEASAQIRFTGWLYRQPVHTRDGTLIKPLVWDGSSKSPGVFALKDHKSLKLSGGSGWNDADARFQNGTPKASLGKGLQIKDWDSDDQVENDAKCEDCDRKHEECKPKCAEKAKKDHKSAYGKDDVGNGYLFINKDAIRDGAVSKCNSQDCEPYSCGTSQSPKTCYHKCPKDCVEVALATPNNFGYDSVDLVGGSGTFDYKLRDSGNSCVAPKKSTVNVVLSPEGKGGVCNDECKGWLNDQEVDVGYGKVSEGDLALKGGSNTLKVDIINKQDAASYARGYVTLATGTGAYQRCEVGKEIKENCLCGTSNVNVLDDKKDSSKGDYGEWELVVKEKRFCCADGSVVDDGSKCPSAGKCPTEKDKVVLESKHTGCMCGTSSYDYLRDGPGYCCSEQTCEGQKCTSGQGFASGRKGENDLANHEYKLEYKSGSYSVYLDGKLLKSKASSERPKGIHFGNELRPTSDMGTWTSLKIDSIKVIDGQGKDFFLDDFNSLDQSKWVVDKGDGSVDVSDGWVVLDAPFTNKFPYVRNADSQKVFPDAGDFTVILKMQYTKVTGHGTYFWLSPGIFKVGQDDSAPGGSNYGIWRLRIFLLNDMVYACGGIGGCGTKTCNPSSSSAQVASLSPVQGCAKPGKFGVHMMLQEFSTSEFGKQLDKVKELTGECAFVKNLVADVGYKPDVQKWSLFLAESGKRKLIPVLRLQGRKAGLVWEKPDSSNNYASVASKYVEFIKSVESESKVKVSYVEIWNEPNLAEEWGGTANPGEYASFLLAVSKSIREYDLKDGKKDINIMNGGLALTGQTSNGNYQTQAFISGMFEKAPELKDYIDVWSVHPYPPEERKYKDQIPLPSFSSPIPVMISETSWQRCSDSSCSSITNKLSPEQFVSIYRDVWMPDQNIIGITPFVFTSQDLRWSKFNLVNAGTLQGNEYYNALKAYRESVR
ncbi:hypothetical protein HYU11_05175 [Candidatus Woesearchaeota archaeon]|nr:hypothetical protein [Candidatus Woesearchaeota archaeon]